MQRTCLETLAWRILRLLPPLALLATAFAAMPVQAGPYSLCASLLNSSHPGRTLESGCAGIEPNLDPNAVSVTLSSQDFGSFEGSASATSDAFDTVRLFASVSLTDYKSGSYVPEFPGGGIPFAASAFATYRDEVTVTGPDQFARMQVTFGVSGTLDWNGVAAQLCYGFAFGGPLQGGVCEVSETLPSQITLTSQLFAVNTAQEFNFMFEAVVFVADQGYPDPYTASATADLMHTITLEEMLVVGANGQPIPGITLISEGGFAYPLSPLNQAPGIAEPGTAALIVAAGLLLGWGQRRRPGLAAVSIQARS